MKTIILSMVQKPKTSLPSVPVLGHDRKIAGISSSVQPDRILLLANGEGRLPGLILLYRPDLFW